MTTKKEQILVRLEEICRTVPGVAHVARNDINVPDNKLPALIPCDGDEAPNQIEEGRRRTGSKQLIDLLPSVLIFGMSEGPGTTLNELQGLLIPLVVFDAQLQQIVGANGSIIPLGSDTDLGWGRAFEGKLAQHFAITFVRDPARP